MSAAPRLFEAEPPTRPIPIRRIGALLIAPNGVPRRLFGVVRDQIEDISACLSESRDHDAYHDIALLSAERLALRGVQVATIQECGCRVRYAALLSDIRMAQAEDAKEDDCVIRAWTTAKRLAGCIGRALVARKKGAGR